MCGFTGIFKFDGLLAEADQISLPVMTNRLSHRGPDESGQWSEDGIGLGHRRLSILDLSPDGRQPMHSLNHRYVIAYNGEVYNFEILRRKLEEEGVVFKSSGDTQVIIEAFSRWGIEETLPQLNGMFSIALWDRHKKELTLMRDAAGIKPLFWARIAHGVIFGSEIKSLKSHSAFESDIDEEALGDYFNRTYIAAPRTIYKNCYRLKPGEILSVRNDGTIVNSSFSSRPDYKFFSPALSGHDLINAFEQEMSRAVSSHMRADVPVAAFLSGGNDSALVAALAANTGNFKTYSVGYEEKSYDESYRAQLIASHLSLHHEVLMVGYKDVAWVLDSLSNFYDEPFADASALPTHILSRHVAHNSKVALSGDGADELFAGYPRYLDGVREWNRMSVLPLCLRPMVSKLIPVKPDRIVYPLAGMVFSEPARTLPHIKSMLSQPSILACFQALNYIGIDPALCKKPDLLDVTQKDISRLTVGSDLLRSLLSYDQAIRLPEGMLTKVDRASMAASLEVRVPFLDSNIISLSRELSHSALAPDRNSTKKIIKDVLTKYLPADIVNAPKTGFHVPMKLWLRQYFTEWAQDLLSGNDDPYIDLAATRSLWERYARGGQDGLFYGLWCILMYRQWIYNR